MGYRYPKLCNWILFKNNHDGTYTAKDCVTQDTFTMGSTVTWFAKRLDGRTDPYTLSEDLAPEDVRDMLDALEKEGLLRHSRVLESSPGSISYSVVIPKKYRSRSLGPILFNHLLLFLWIPVFLLGVWCVATHFHNVTTRLFWPGSIIGILLGLLLHEAGHALASLCYGGRVFEAGVLIRKGMPGAYILSDDSPIKSRMKRIQVLAAGVEMNSLLAGISFVLAAFLPGWGGFFFGFGANNFLVAIVNLTLANGLDGMQILGELLGAEHLVFQTEYTLQSRKRRKKLCRSGVNGWAELSVCYLVQILRHADILLVVLSILEVIGWVLS